MSDDPGDDIVIELRADEVRLLRTLSVDLRRRLKGARDAVVQRLFPAVVHDDADLDREVRRLIHDDLMQQRLGRLDEVLALLDVSGDQHVRLRGEQPGLLLGVLNDLRLALAVQSGLDQPREERGTMDRDTEQIAAVLDWLAWWQERLLRSLDPDALRFYEEESDLSA